MIFKKLFIFLVVIFSTFKGICGDIPTPGSLIFGDFIKQATDKINDLISHAQAAGEILEIEAGGQILKVIDQAKYAYQFELQLTLSQLQASEINAVNDINSVLTQFEEKTYTDLNSLLGKAQSIADDLPFSKHFPQIRSWSPQELTQNFKNSSSYRVKFILSGFNVNEYSRMSTDTIQRKNYFNRFYNILTDKEKSFYNDSVLITVSGDFYDLYKKKYQSQIKINSSAIGHINSFKTSGQIGFLIPKSEFTCDDNKIMYNFCTISIPYRKTVLLFFGKKINSEFKIPITCLPKKLGTLTVTTHVLTPGTQTVGRSAGEYSQISSDDDIKCGGEHADLAIHCVGASPGGWQIIPGSVSYHMNNSDGEWNYCGPDHSTLGEACVNFNTIHHGWGTSGKIWFNITYTETRDIINDSTKVSSLTLNWGDQRQITIPQGATWTAEFIQFDGKSIDFSGPLTNNPYIVVTTAGLTINIKAIP